MLGPIVEDLGKVDVGCANAGINGGDHAEKYGLKDWRKMLDVNVHGTFLVAREAGEHMLERYIRGSFIMVSSTSGIVLNRPQKQSAYNAVSAPTYLRAPLRR
jgi:sorbose reductase